MSRSSLAAASVPGLRRRHVACPAPAALRSARLPQGIGAQLAWAIPGVRRRARQRRNRMAAVTGACIILRACSSTPRQSPSHAAVDRLAASNGARMPACPPRLHTPQPPRLVLDMRPEAGVRAHSMAVVLGPCAHARPDWRRVPLALGCCTSVWCWPPDGGAALLYTRCGRPGRPQTASCASCLCSVQIQSLVLPLDSRTRPRYVPPPLHPYICSLPDVPDAHVLIGRLGKGPISRAAR
jgi:hypothetical protein